MKSLKSHLFLIFSLISIFFSIEVFMVMDKIVTQYSKKIINHYNILVVSKTPIKKLDIDNVLKIEKIDITQNLVNLKKQLKNFDVSQLQESLPYFYRVYFNTLLTPKQLNIVETSLLKNKNIVRIETFRKNQTHTYNLLTIIKSTLTIFMVIIFIISTLLIIKQLEVWRLEHSERMYIMELFGAPFSLRSAVLLRLALLDSLFSVIGIFLIMEYIFNLDIYKDILFQLDVSIDINIFIDSMLYLVLGLSISFVATTIVVFSKKD